MRLVVALGGNAILQRGEKGTAEEQFHHVEIAVSQILKLVKAGHDLVITHGNGPQVGDILEKDECASDHLPRMPLDICGAESQGMIGYMIQQSLVNALAADGVNRAVLTVVTQTLVDQTDPNFMTPKKPIGPYYSFHEAERLRAVHGWNIAETSGGGWRRVVPSPLPRGIVEGESIRSLFQSGYIVIAAGGGGVPVVLEGGIIRGTEAVIDKDRSAVCLALAVGAEVLLILTDVPAAYLRFGRTDQRPLGSITDLEAEKWLNLGEFGEGSMAPKIEACIRFVREGGKHAVITSLDLAESALYGEAGTCIHR
jgi:carbamate kinase